jgi:hypothetical protein
MENGQENGAVTLTLDTLLHRATSSNIFLTQRNDDLRLLVAKEYNLTDIESQPNLAQRVLNERHMLEVASTVPHVNLVGFEGAYVSTAAVWICTEAVGGSDLFALFQTHGPFAPEHARFYIGEVSLALGHLHSLDIIHRSVTVCTHGTHALPFSAAVPDQRKYCCLVMPVRAEREHTRRIRWPRQARRLLPRHADARPRRNPPTAMRTTQPGRLARFHRARGDPRPAFVRDSRLVVSGGADF